MHRYSKDPINSTIGGVYMRSSYALLITAALLPLAGCASRHDSDEKYFLVTTNKQVPYWTSAAAGLERAGREMRVPTEVAGPDNYDPKAEQEEFRRVVARKPSGILVSPADPNLLAPDIQAAVAQGIPVITVDSDAPSCVWTKFSVAQPAMRAVKLLQTARKAVCRLMTRPPSPSVRQLSPI